MAPLLQFQSPAALSSKAGDYNFSPAGIADRFGASVAKILHALKELVMRS